MTIILRDFLKITQCVTVANPHFFPTTRLRSELVTLAPNHANPKKGSPRERGHPIKNRIQVLIAWLEIDAVVALLS